MASPNSVAYLESASGDDEPANSHSVFNFGSPDGGLLRGRNAYLMQTKAWAGLQVLSGRPTAGAVVLASGLACSESASGVYRRAACRLVRSIPSLISPWQASTANSRERNLTGPCTARLPR